MNHHPKLLLLCVRGLSTYNPDKVSIDEHVTMLLKSGECADLNEADHVFITEVLAGCTRYVKLIQVTVDAFYVTEGKTCLRADYNLFIVVGYLVMFRLEELGLPHMRKFIFSQDTVNMYKLLSFLFEEERLKTWIHTEWCKVYDQSFVQTNVLLPMMRSQPEMSKLIQELKDMVENKHKPKSSSAKGTTDPKPFNLTKPRPRNVPTPEKIPRLKVYKPAPKTTYRGPPEKESIEKMRETAKKRAEEKYQEAERLKFACATTEKSEKTKAVIHQILQEREDKEIFEPLKPSPMPATLNDTVPIKMNAAAILREGARVQREEDEVLHKLAGLEAGEKDDSEFLQWKEQMKQKEAVEALAEIERKHLAGQLSYEEAIIARQSHFQETREKVKALREESEQVMNRYFEEREEEKREMRRLVEAIAEGRENVKESREKLQKMKQEIVQQVAKESRELMKQALEEAEEEMRKKTELIQQIRAMESIPVIRHKFVDITESSGHGLLLEMSIAELRERLSLMKIAEQEEREQRRMDIAATKEAKDKMLTETLENISRHRKEKTKAAVESNVQKQQSMAKLLSTEREQKVVGLQQQLENKRKMRERLQQDNSVTGCQVRQSSAQSGTTAKWSEVKKNRSATQLSGGKKKVAVAVPPTAGGSHSSAMTTLLRSAANV